MTIQGVSELPSQPLCAGRTNEIEKSSLSFCDFYNNGRDINEKDRVHTRVLSVAKRSVRRDGRDALLTS